MNYAWCKKEIAGRHVLDIKRPDENAIHHAAVASVYRVINLGQAFKWAGIGARMDQLEQINIQLEQTTTILMMMTVGCVECWRETGGHPHVLERRYIGVTKEHPTAKLQLWCPVHQLIGEVEPP